VELLHLQLAAVQVRGQHEREQEGQAGGLPGGHGCHGDEIYKELAEVEMMQETRQLVIKTRNRLAHRLKLGVMAQGWMRQSPPSRQG
jgi:hypothetical protein